MAPNKEKIKPNKANREPLKVPDCKGIKGEVWYPPDWFIEQVQHALNNGSKKLRKA